MQFSPTSSHKPQGFSLFVHTLAPTGISLTIYILIGCAITAAHLVALSVTGTAYPEHLDESLLIGYANFVIQPILTITNSTVVNRVLTLALWAIVGSLVAASISTVTGLFNSWRAARDDITVPRYGVVIRHPLQHSLIMRLVWRSIIGVAIACYTILALSAIRYCFASDLHMLDTALMSEMAWRFGLAVGIWVSLLHGYVILLRLYMQRTRIFGEILY